MPGMPSVGAAAGGASLARTSPRTPAAAAAAGDAGAAAAAGSGAGWGGGGDRVGDDADARDRHLRPIGNADQRLHVHC